jgi:hypothetical protein
MALWGGVNGHLTIEHGTEDQVRNEVAAALDTLGPSRFVLSPVDNVRDDTQTARANVAVLIDEWQRRWRATA